MKKFTLNATDENILCSIRDNTYNRVKDVKDFIVALKNIEGNAFISLDGNWGEGKSFYVRQIELTLKYIYDKKWNYPVNEVEPYFLKQPQLNELELEKSYLPVYYNAWLYDNHDDPLMSLLLIIAKTCKNYASANIKAGKIGDVMLDLLDSFSLSVGNQLFGIQMQGNTSKMRETLNGKNILEAVQTAEEIREKVKEILDCIITETADKLIIIIDELDRCKPSYAIEMLERIKHYFEDERIIFIVSVNKEQLVHTISKYYGNGFDSTGYLNKFFDMNVHLPIADMSSDYGVGSELSREQFYLKSISEGLNDYFKFTLRDSLIFKQQISKIPEKYASDLIAQNCLISAFAPIIIALDINDQELKRKFVQGDKELLGKLFAEIPALYRMTCNFSKARGYSQENWNEGMRKIEKVYEFVFGTTESKYYEGEININNGLKSLCIKAANGFIC